MSIIALEGSSFSGKTTLTEQLAEYFEAPVVHEYIDYAMRVSPDGFPPFASSRQELDQQISFYLELEADRQRDVASLEHPFIIVDRTVASLAAFHRTQQQYVEESGGYWDIKLMKRRIQLSQKLGRVVVPDLVFVLSAGSKEEHDSRVLRRGAIEAAHLGRLNDWSFSEELRRNTRHALNSIFPTRPVVECVTSIDSRTFGEVIASICEITEEKDD